MLRDGFVGVHGGGAGMRVCGGRRGGKSSWDETSNGVESSTWSLEKEGGIISKGGGSEVCYTEQCVGWNDEDEKTGSFALVLSSL